MPAERPAQGRDRGSERRPEPSKGASRNLRTPLNRPSRGETARFRAIPIANGPRIRPQRPPNRLHPTPIPRRIRLPPPRPCSLRSPRRGGGRPLSPRCRPTHARRPAHPATPLPLAPLPRNRHRPRTRSVATPRSHLDCRNVLILIVAGQKGEIDSPRYSIRKERSMANEKSGICLCGCPTALANEALGRLDR